MSLRVHDAQYLLPQIGRSFAYPVAKSSCNALALFHAMFVANSLAESPRKAYGSLKLNAVLA